MTGTSVDWSGGLDALEPDALQGVELPLATKELLQTGLPHEIRIPGWLGPTLFSSEIQTGQLLNLAGYAGSLGHHDLAQAFVIGTVREVQGAPTIYAAFCLQPKTGDLWIIDVGDPHMVRFVNSQLDQFLRSVRAFLSAWARAKTVPDTDRPIIAPHLRDELKGIDTKAFDHEDNYWPTWLETEFECP